MPFVKLDCGILKSSLWVDKVCRDLFVTALLMAEPFEVREAMPEIAVDSLNYTGWMVPVGWYGLAAAAGCGIAHHAGILDEMQWRAGLQRLAAPDPRSRSQSFDGRRLVRVDGGYIILNYIVYRERDYTGAERMRR